MAAMTKEWVWLWYQCLSANPAYNEYCYARQDGNHVRCAELGAQYEQVCELYEDWGFLGGNDLPYFEEWYGTHRHLFPFPEEISFQQNVAGPARRRYGLNVKANGRLPIELKRVQHAVNWGLVDHSIDFKSETWADHDTVKAKMIQFFQEEHLLVGPRMGVHELIQLRQGIISKEREDAVKKAFYRAEKDFKALSANTIRCIFPCDDTYDVSLDPRP